MPTPLVPLILRLLAAPDSATGVVVTQSSPTPATASATLEFTDGLSAVVPLGSSGLAVRLPFGAPVGASWLVRYTARPSADLSEVAARVEALGDAALVALFGNAPAEPYATFRNLWLSGRDLPERLTGVLLALAYRTRELRDAGRTA